MTRWALIIALVLGVAGCGLLIAACDAECTLTVGNEVSALDGDIVTDAKSEKNVSREVTE